MSEFETKHQRGKIEAFLSLASTVVSEFIIEYMGGLVYEWKYKYSRVS